MRVDWLYRQLDDKPIEGTALLLLLDLTMRAEELNVTKYTLQSLAETTGLERRRVRKLLRTLHRRGYITVAPLEDDWLEIQVTWLDRADEESGAENDDDGDDAEESRFPALFMEPNWN